MIGKGREKEKGKNKVKRGKQEPFRLPVDMARGEV
jgi:hypothetical protein